MLKPCPECRHQVSDSATTCPQCGYLLRGRHLLVACPHCETEVLPVSHPRDTISRYCPLCGRPVTGLEARRVFIAVMGSFILAVVIAFLGFAAFIASRFHNMP
jgi:ribosomal protein S27E